MMSSRYNEVGLVPPMLLLNAAARRLNGTLMSQPRGTDSPAQAASQVQPVDCRDGHNSPIGIRKMPGRFAIYGEEDVLVDFKRSR
jgi:hypothetical protein